MKTNKETIKELRERADELISSGIANKDALFAALPENAASPRGIFGVGGRAVPRPPLTLEALVKAKMNHFNRSLPRLEARSQSAGSLPPIHK